MKQTIPAGGDSVRMELALLVSHSSACTCETSIKEKADNIPSNLPGDEKIEAVQSKSACGQ